MSGAGVRDFEAVGGVLLTGLPRSGTTLLTALLDDPPRSVALGEPRWQAQWRRHNAPDPAAFAAYLVEDFTRIRAALLRGETVEDRIATDGRPLTNYLQGGMRSFALRPRRVEALTPGFRLVMKWPALYTAVLPALVATGVFRIVALLRHPLATLRSWNATDFPIARGRLPVGEPFWPELAELCGSERPLAEKQACIWELFAARYLALVDRITLLRYEDLVADPAAVAARLGLDFAEGPVVKAAPRPLRDSVAEQEAAAAVAAFCPSARRLYGEAGEEDDDR